jgi:putative membrane protein
MSRHYVRAALFFGFAVLIAKLFIANEMVKYMSAALDPLTALTALVLAIMGALELQLARGGRATSDGRHEGDITELILTGLVLAVPLAIGLFMTPRALGASALGGESISGLLLTFSSAPAAPGTASPPPPPRPIEDVSDLLAYLRRHGVAGVGQHVQATGFVAPSDDLGSDELGLLRYSIAHCVADARPLGLLVVAGEGATWATDQWVQVAGTLQSRERDGDHLVTIVADSIIAIPEPANPYLTSSQESGFSIQ